MMLAFLLTVLTVRTTTGYRIRWITFNRNHSSFGEPGVYIREFSSLWPALRWGLRCAGQFTDLDEIAVAPGQQSRGLPVQDVGGVAVAGEAGGLSVTEDASGRLTNADGGEK